MLIAIAFADLHAYKFHLFNKDNRRLKNSLEALRTISQVAANKKVPILFAGDMFHTPKEVENETLFLTLNQYRLYIEEVGTKFYAISGNHDMSEKNSLQHESPSYLDTFRILFKTFNHLVQVNMRFDTKNFTVYGVQYMNNDADLKEAIESVRKYTYMVKGFKILLLHSDAPGALDINGGYKPESEAIPKDLDNFFKDWDLVLFGHIHRPQKLSEKCYMLGSPIHQTSGDTAQMGYWEIYNDQPPIFVGLEEFPKFIRLEKGQEAPDTKNYYIPYEEVGNIEEVEKGDFNISLSRERLARNYMKVKGIKSKVKKKALINVLNQIE